MGTESAGLNIYAAEPVQAPLPGDYGLVQSTGSARAGRGPVAGLAILARGDLRRP